MLQLPYQIVHGFEDIQANFETITGLSTIATGIATLSFTASTNSGNTVVTHKLGRVPVVVVATSFFAAAFGQIPNCNTFAYTSTAFTVNGMTASSFTGSATVAWIAV